MRFFRKFKTVGIFFLFCFIIFLAFFVNIFKKCFFIYIVIINVIITNEKDIKLTYNRFNSKHLDILGELLGVKNFVLDFFKLADSEISVLNLLEETLVGWLEVLL